MIARDLLAALVVLAAALPAGAAPDPLARYRWSARLLVVSAPDAADPGLAAQRRAYEAARAGAAERDLVWVEAVGEEGGAVRRRLGLPEGAFRAVLVGKDGGAKLVSATPIGADRLFQEIDAMPMRREEAGDGPRRRGR